MTSPFGQLLAVATADARSLRRSPGAWLLGVLAACTGLAAYYVVAYVHATVSYYEAVVSPRFLVNVLAIVPFLVLLFGVALLAGEGRQREILSRLAESVDARPPGNICFIVGRWLALVVTAASVLLTTFVTIQGFGLAARAFDWPVGEPIEAVSLVVFLGVDALPALALWCAVVLLLATVLRRGFVALIAFGLLAGTHWLLHNAPIHLLPAISILPSFGVVASDLVPRFVDGWVLAQRAFVVLLAGGLLATAAGIYPRPEGQPSARFGELFAGAMLAMVAAAGLALLAARSGSDLALRDKWLAAQRAVDSGPHPDVETIAGHVRIDPRSRLTLAVDMTLSRPDAASAEFVFSFNPGMRVQSVLIDAEAAEYRHESGLLIVSPGSPLEPGATTTLSVHATGVPDPRFAYLDSGVDPLSENWKTSLLPFFGTAASIFNDGYVALTPGVRWLPMPGPNLVPDPRHRPRDFFTIDLVVESPTGWQVAAPGRGRPTRQPNQRRFRPGAPLDEVTVVAAPFQRYAVDSAGVELELLLHPAHLRNVELLAGFEEAITERLTGYVERASDYGTPYPYDGLTVVEAPASLRVYGGGPRMDSVLNSPGVLFMREHGFPTARFNRVLRFLFSRDFPASSQVSPVFLYFLRSRVGENLLAGASEDLLLSVTGPRGAYADMATAVLTRLAAMILGARQNVFSAHAFTETSLSETGTAINANVYYAIRIGAFLAGSAARVYKKGRWDWDHPSLWDRATNSAWVDISQGDDPHHDLATRTLIADAVSGALVDSLKRDGAGELVGELRRQHAGRTFALEDLLAAATQAGFPLNMIADDWLRRGTLPGFAVSQAEVRRLAGDDSRQERYHVRLLVRNEEAAWGIVSLEVGTDPDEAGQSTLRREWLDPIAVPGHSTVEIGLLRTVRPAELWLLSYLSKNRADMQLVLQQADEDPAPRQGPPFVGVRPASWLPAAEPGIIVDDLDPGFAVQSMRPKGFMERLAERSANKTDAIHLDQGIPAHRDAERGMRSAPEGPFARPQWRRQDFGSAWGKYRRTLARIRSGDGTEQAVFTAHLPLAGRWRLEYHVPYLLVEARSKVMAQHRKSFGHWSGGPLGKSRFTLVAHGQETDIEFDAGHAYRGWNPIGTFDLDAGDVRLRVSNRSSGETVIADAIRWRRVVHHERSPAGRQGTG